MSSPVWVFPPLAPIVELDVMVVLMSAAAMYHAHTEKDPVVRKENYVLIVTSFLLGLATEHASLRFGGTHCHASGTLNFSECSSVNSVCYYIGWIYTCILVARRLTRRSDGSTSWAFPFLTGGLFFGMCGVYEMQGPLMGWWLWPQADGMIKPGCDIWQYGAPGLNTEGMVTTEHVEEALGERAFGFPILAPYFHSAFGWGIGLALQLTVPSFSMTKVKKEKKLSTSTIIGIVSSVLLGPALGMLWDPPIRILKQYVGASKIAAAPAIMVLTYLIPLIAGEPLATPRYEGKRDLILAVIPLIQHVYFVSNCFFRYGKDVIPGNLKLFVLCVAGISLLVHTKATGYFNTNQSDYSTGEDDEFFFENDSDGGEGDKAEAEGLVVQGMAIKAIKKAPRGLEILNKEFDKGVADGQKRGRSSGRQKKN